MAVVLTASVTGQAQELDTARQCYAAIFHAFGHWNYPTPDTTTDSTTYVLEALNAGLRAVQHDKPFTVEDTIVLAKFNYRYTLNSNFARPEDGKPSGYRVEHWDSVNATLTGLREKTVGEFGSLVQTAIIGFRVEGNQLIADSYQPDGDKLFVYGPGESTRITGSGTVLTYPPETIDRWAAVYYAIWKIANDREDAARAQQYAGEYQRITGVAPQMIGAP